MKPIYKRSREEVNETNDQDDNDEIRPLTRVRVEIGPQGSPKLSAEIDPCTNLYQMLVYLQL